MSLIVCDQRHAFRLGQAARDLVEQQQLAAVAQSARVSSSRLRSSSVRLPASVLALSEQARSGRARRGRGARPRGRAARRPGSRRPSRSRTPSCRENGCGTWKAARDAARDAAAALRRVMSRAVEHDPARVGRERAGDQVEHRGLARAVRARSCPAPRPRPCRSSASSATLTAPNAFSSDWSSRIMRAVLPGRGGAAAASAAPIACQPISFISPVIGISGAAGCRRSSGRQPSPSFCHWPPTSGVLATLLIGPFDQFTGPTMVSRSVRRDGRDDGGRVFQVLGARDHVGRPPRTARA